MSQINPLEFFFFFFDKYFFLQLFLYILGQCFHENCHPNKLFSKTFSWNVKSKNKQRANANQIKAGFCEMLSMPRRFLFSENVSF